MYRLVIWLGIITCPVLMLGQTMAMQSAADEAKFSRNNGQWDNRVAFKLRLNFGDVLLEQNALTFSLLDAEVLQEVMGHHGGGHGGSIDTGITTIPGHAFQIRFKDAMPIVAVEGERSYQHYENYYLGKDRSKWASNVPVYAQVRYGELYPGIDMTISGSGPEKLKYDFTVAPGADPDQIVLEFDGVEDIYLEDGQLHYKTSVSHIYEEEPVAYQIIEGEKVWVPCKFKLRRNEVSFELPKGYDKNYELVIDPTLVFSSYTGATTDNWGYTATYDNDGNLYAGGIIFRSAGYPLVGAFQAQFAGGDFGNFSTSYACDIGISKFTADGSSLIYSTYLGGSGNEAPHSLVVTNQNELIVYGTSSSVDYPLGINPYQGFKAGGQTFTVTNVVQFLNGTDIVVTKFNAAGSALMGSTYIGGSGNDGVNMADSLMYNYADHARGEVVVDSNDFVYIASSTMSTDFPTTTGASQTNPLGGQDACVIKLTPNLDALVWSTYYGGANDDAGYSLKVTDIGDVIFCGGTKSTTLPNTANGYNSTYQGGITDGYVSRLSANGSTVLNTTYLGTNQYDQAYLLTLDFNGDVFVYGQSGGAYPFTPGKYFNPASHQFIHKLEDDLSSEFFSTIFGSTGLTINIAPTALLVDVCDNIYISGWGGQVNTDFGFGNLLGTTQNMPITPDATQSTTDGSDFYFMVLGKDADSLVFGTYFGGVGTNGEHVDGGTSRFDEDGVIYQAVCASCGGTNIFPTTPGAWAEVNGQLNAGNCNQGVIKYAFELAELELDIDLIPDGVGCVPYFLQFNSINVSGPDANGWIWDFGNGDTLFNDIQNPPVFYPDTGFYTVRLIGLDSITCSGLTLYDTAFTNVFVYDDSIVPNFNMNVLDDCDPYIVQFDNATVNFGLGPQNYLWDFGDGDTSTQISPLHEYDTAGTYVITLIVDAPNTCTQRDTLTDTITFLPRQDASLNLLDSVLCITDPITFQSNATPGTVQFFNWDFGDGSPNSSDPTPTHIYTSTGAFDVVLTVQDTNACNPIIVDSATVQVVEDTIIADFTFIIIDDCDSLVVDFANTSVNASSFVWDFGDGDTSSQLNPRHEFSSAGSYTVTLIAIEPLSCNAVDTAQVQITFPPRQTIAFDLSDSIVCAPATIQFTNNSTAASIQDFVWDFGDGSPVSTAINPAHDYLNAGTYTVVLTATDTAACNPFLVDSAIINVVEDTLTVDFNFQIIDDCDSFVVSFSNNSTFPAVYRWDFGDGDSSVQTNPTHEYVNAGTYTIKLFASLGSGCNSLDSTEAMVTFLPRQEVDFDLSDTLDCAPAIIQFNNNSVPATLQEYVWDFGDFSQPSNDSNPVHVYPNPGNYTIVLTATDTGACNPVVTDTSRLTVVDDSLVVDFSAQVIADCDSFVVAFTNQSVNATNYTWYFGDGDSSTLLNPTHEFDAAGTYTVLLIGSDLFGCGKKDTAEATFTFLPQQTATIDVSDIDGCVPFQALFINQGSGTVFQEVVWNFGDNTMQQTGDTVTHRFNAVGQFTVVLTATDTGACNPIIVDSVQITVTDDTVGAAFSYNFLIDNCDSLQVAFVDESVNANAWFWTFGDGNTSTDQNPIHTYTETGVYDVTLVVRNNATCNGADTATSTIFKKPEVTADFFLPNGCQPYSRVLNNNSANATSYTWGLNGDELSTEEEPLIQLNDTGVYIITLTAGNPESCNLTDISTDTFTVFGTPTAFFTTDSSRYGIFEDIQFTNESTAPALYNWEFGDGATSEADNPLHKYSNEGFYEPCLTVTDLNNCEAVYCDELDIIFRGIIGVPNAFSPNDDQLNDILFVEGYGVATMEFKIYNRWGELVFESNSLANGWDGTYKGKKQEKEVYVYTLQATFVDGSETELLRGNISLLR